MGLWSADFVLKIHWFNWKKNDEGKNTSDFHKILEDKVIANPATFKS